MYRYGSNVRRRTSRNINPAAEKSLSGQDAVVAESGNTEVRPCLSNDEKFAAHISNYLGQTVTVFVRSGGASGAGFTGVLFYICRYYIKLLSRIGPPPACSLWSSCRMPYATVYGANACYRRMLSKRFVSNVGSITCIPVDKIASFVHNSI